MARYIFAIYSAMGLKMFVSIVVDMPVFSSTGLIIRNGNRRFLDVWASVISMDFVSWFSIS